MALTGNEKTVIERFLKRYNEYHASSFTITSWPDEIDRTGKAIDAIANDGATDLGIEHTLLQPFTGEKRDSHVFTKTVGQLDQKASLVLPDYDVDLVFPVGAVSPGFDWSLVAPAVESWYLDSMHSVPVGVTPQQIPNLPVPLSVTVDKAKVPGKGHFFVSRSMPSETVEDVVRQALNTKLPKLLAATVKQRVLLLEKNSLPRGYGEIGAAIEALLSQFSELKNLDEVWVINTVALESEGYAPSYLVWPSTEVTKFSKWRHGV